MKFIKVASVCILICSFMPAPKSTSGVTLQNTGFMLQVQSSAPDWVYVQITNTNDNTISYYIQIPPSGSGEQFVIAGDYDVTVWPSNTAYYHDYSVGCNDLVIGNQASQYVFSEPIALNEGCNSVSVGGHY
ncbi:MULTISPECIES: hypothetical protein [Niastella]|uniref:Uncharacterized protein n=1 Tax=Niastella soli TaxID=2821487 RepID=A0ABS3YSS1_9BACT|nr:hypothetical protein [Niastella soli]MBO9200913.1 hypothetical protein [Niastella soli]